MIPSFKVRVVETTVGRGVVAALPIDGGEVVGQVVGRVIEDPTHGSEYCIDMGDYSLEPITPFRYLNHSCDPNAAFVHYEDEPDRLFLEAMHPIEPGEAITIDYSWPAECSIPCRCGSASCRGWIVAEEEQHQITEECLAEEGSSPGPSD